MGLQVVWDQDYSLTFNEDGETVCECGVEQTMKHMLVCHIQPQPVPMKTWKSLTPEIEPAPGIGRESCNDSKIDINNL